MVEVAPALVDDAAGIAKVHVLSWQAAYADILDPAYLASLSIEDRCHRWQAILATTESQTLVARRAGDVVGFVSFGRCRDAGAAPTAGEIWALYALPSCWGGGVGRTLLDRAIQALESQGFTSQSLWVLAQNHRGLNFYRSCGFRQVERSEKHFELGGRQVEEVAYRRQTGA